MIDIPPTPKQEASEDTTRKDDEKKAGFPPSVEASEGDSSENKLTSDAEQKPNAGALLWFEVLTTPTTDGDCSPSRDVKMQQPLHHGVGLQLAFDRCRQLTRTGRRSANFFLDVATSYEQYTQALLKIYQCHLQLLARHQPIGISALSLQESIISWTAEISKLTKTVGTDIAKPWQDFATTHGETSAGVQQRYLQSRQKCLLFRRRAQLARDKYVKAFRETEQTIAEWKEEKNEDGPDPGAITPPKRVYLKLQDVRGEQTQYTKMVKIENDCVMHCQRLEVMALESMQKLEEDRIFIFSNSLIKFLSAEKEALERVVFSMTKSRTVDHVEKKLSDNVVSEKKAKSSAFANLLKSTSSGLPNPFIVDEGSGLMDVETLGLPEDIGKLRDQVRSQLATRASRVEAGREFVRSLESMASASEKLSSAIMKSICNEDKNKEVLRAAMRSCEGPRILHLWDSLMEVLSEEADAALSLSASLRAFRNDKLDQLALHGERLMKAASDSDDALWKQLCEAGRTQIRAEDHYRQTTAQTAKARERVKSVDANSGQVQKQDVSAKVNKHLANMFSILPNEGEQMMKILTPGTRAGIAQISLEDADQKETRGRKQLDAAVEATSRAMNAYRLHAKSLCSRYKEEDEKGWEDIRSKLQSLVHALESLRGARLKKFEKLKPLMDPDAVQDIFVDANEWRANAQQIVASKLDKAREEKPGVEFMLSVQLETSVEINKLIDALEKEKCGQSMNDFTSLEETESNDFDVASISITSGPHDDQTEIENTNSSILHESSGSLVVNLVKRARLPSASELSFSTPTRRARLPSASELSSSTPTRYQKVGKPDSFHEKESIEEGTLSYQGKDAESSIFLQYFWPDKRNADVAVTVVESFSCSFRDGSQCTPYQYGRIFLTPSTLFFLSWTGKKLSLKWEQVLAIQPVKSFTGSDDDTLMVTTEKGRNEEGHALFGSFFYREKTINVVKRVWEQAEVIADEVSKTGVSTSSGNAVNLVPPDTVLQKMKVILTRKLHHISIKRFYEIVWSEGNETYEKPLYEPWLKKGSFDVEVGNWFFTKVTGSWCGEQYSQKRSVSFKQKRTTHLYIGPPIVNVKQTQYCRVEGNDKCVLSMTVEFEGLPYSDTFSVEVRWVARREGVGDIIVEVGVFVDFKKSTFLKNKITSGTLEETTPVHKDLFETARAACIAADGAVDVPEAVVEPVIGTDIEIEKDSTIGRIQLSAYSMAICGLLVCVAILWYFLFCSVGDEGESLTFTQDDIEQLGHRLDRLEIEIKAVQETLNEVLLILKEKSE